MIYPFLNFRVATVEVWEGISNFFPNFIVDVIIYPCRDLSQTMLVKGTTSMLMSKWHHTFETVSTLLALHEKKTPVTGGNLTVCTYILRSKFHSGGRFKNAYELLNLRALKISMLYKSHIFQCMGKIFCVEFQRVPLKFHTKYLAHTLKDKSFMKHWNFKSS